MNYKISIKYYKIKIYIYIYYLFNYLEIFDVL